GARPDVAPRAPHGREWGRAAAERPGLFRAGAGGAAVHFGRSGLPCRIHRNDRGPQAMRYSAIAYRLPRPLRRHVLHFEYEIEDAIASFARQLPEDARI